MKREYVAPDFYSEEFVLSQHVAKGCGTSVTIVPGSQVTVNFGCEQCFNPDGSMKPNQPGGHWYYPNVTIKDLNGDGQIQWNEIVAACGTANNGVETGQGHEHHDARIVLPSGEEIKVIPENS